MMPHVFFYQLVLIALVWLFVMLYVAWPSQRTAPEQRPPTPSVRPRKHSTAPKPFTGLIHKPHCAACEQSAAQPKLSAPVPPAPMPIPKRRPRQVDTSQHFCPHPTCDYRGRVGWGNLRANGHPNGGLWRQFHCTACEGSFLETHGTIFHGKRVPVELIVRVLACLAEGLGIRATARVFEMDPNTVLHWLIEAAEQLQAFAASFLCDIHVEQLQLDEWFAVLREVKRGALSEDAAIERLECSPAWVWTAIDPASKLLVVIDVGTRTLAMAQRVVHQVAQVLAPGCLPLFLTDGLKDYGTALLCHFGTWTQPERRQDKGPRPKPRWMPLPTLLYAQVIKTTRQRRLVQVSHRVVFGTLEAVNQVLAPHGWQINTSFVERLNLSLRQQVAAIGRRTATLCKGEAGLHQQLALYQTYYNFVLPHASLCHALPQPVPTNGTGSAT